MKVKELIKLLCDMNMEADVVVEIPKGYTDSKYAFCEHLYSVSMDSEEKCLIEGR